VCVCVNRPLSGVSGASLGSARQTPRVNHYLQDIRPTTPLQSLVLARGGARQSTTAAVSRDFRAPSPLAHDPATGKIVVVPRYSRPTSAASDVTNLSQMNPMAVRLTPLGAVFGGEDDDSMDSDSHMGLVTGVYLDEMLQDPVPFHHADLAPVTPSTPSPVDSPPVSQGLSPHCHPAQAPPALVFIYSLSLSYNTYVYVYVLCIYMYLCNMYLCSYIIHMYIYVCIYVYIMYTFYVYIYIYVYICNTYIQSFIHTYICMYIFRGQGAETYEGSSSESEEEGTTGTPRVQVPGLSPFDES
jgi:hypothetical protein